MARISSRKIWLIVGAVVLIALLLVWMEMAFLSGDTDVAALIAPLLG